MASIIGKLTGSPSFKLGHVMKHPNAVSRMVRDDELTENMEYMMSRGKDTKVKEHNRKAKTESGKIYLAPIPEWRKK